MAKKYDYNSGGYMAKGSKPKVIYTQFEEEEFEYADGGTTGNFAFKVGDIVMIKQEGYGKLPFVIIKRFKIKQSDGTLAYYYEIKEEGETWTMMYEEEKLKRQGNKPTTNKKMDIVFVYPSR